MTLRRGLAVSLLVHGGLFVGVWLWQQHRPAQAAPSVPVVQVRLLAPAIPTALPVPASDPVPRPQANAEPQPTPAPAPQPESKPEPKPKPEPELKPPPRSDVRQQPVARPEPVPAQGQRRPTTEPVQSATGTPVSAATSPSEALPMPAPPAVEQPAKTRLATLRDAYRADLLARIERHRFYPDRARRRGLSGEVRVRFRIAADGRLGQVQLVTGSGVALLDRAALQTIARLVRVAPLPPELDLDHWDLVVPIVFRLQG